MKQMENPKLDGRGVKPEVPMGKKVVLVILALAVLAALVLAVRWYLDRRAHVGTDDAFVTGNLVQVGARIPGQVANLTVDEGSQVRSGQVVAQLDDTDLKAQVAQAQANLALAETGLAPGEQGVSLTAQESAAKIAQAEAGLAAAQANDEKARADLHRMKNLYKAGAVSRQQYEAATAGATAADSQLAATRAGLAAAQAGATQISIEQGGVKASQARIGQAEAALHLAELNLAHATITSPVDGTVVKRFVNAGEMVAPGQPLFDITQSNDVWVVANVEETDIHRVQVGAPVDITVDAYPGRHFKGHVADVIGATGSEFSLIPQNNAVGNFTKVVQRIPVRIDLDRPEPDLKPGMSAVVSIEAK